MNEQAHQPSREPSNGEFVYRYTLMRVESLPAPPRASTCPDRDGSAPSRGLSGVFRRVPMMRRAVGERTSTEPPGRGAALARSGRRLTAGLLLAFVGLLALLPEAQAQTPINSAPTFDDGTSTSREFNETIGEATVTTASDIETPVAATDTDTGDTLEYSLSGTDAAKFTVDTGNGQIKTVVGETYDHEAKASYAVTVTVEDGNGGSATIDVTLNVTDQDEPPLRPVAPTVRGPSGNSTTSLSVTMRAPDNSGRPPITRYKLRTHRDGFGWTNLPYNPSSAQIITGITSGKRYHVQFRVKNDEGEGPWSPTTFGYTKAHASGMPDISGTARVGRTLTAGTSGISDGNGKSKAENGDVGFAYTYQWVRVDGGTETDISGETASTYTLTMADLGKTVKVTASFKDNAGYEEGPLTSDAYPSSGTIALLELSFVENIVEVNEAAGSTVLTVNLAPASTETVTVDYATRDFHAEEGEDYTATSGTLTFAANETSKTITIPILNDDIYEGLETFFVDLSNPSGTALPAIPNKEVQIASDDAVPTASMAPVTVDEGAGTMTLTLRVSHPSGEDITYSTIDDQVTGTATEGDDYDDFLLQGGRRARITIPAGNLLQTFNISIVNDNFEETDETIVITWRRRAGDAVTPESFGFTGTIEDNDEGAGAARGKAKDYWHGGGRPDADGQHLRHLGPERQNEGGERRRGLCLHLPVVPGGRRRADADYGCEGKGEDLHAGPGRCRRDVQGRGALHRRRGQQRGTAQEQRISGERCERRAATGRQ